MQGGIWSRYPHLTGQGGGGLDLQEELLRGAFEFSPGFIALAAGQVKVGVSTMVAKVVAQVELQVLGRRRKLDGLKGVNVEIFLGKISSARSTVLRVNQKVGHFAHNFPESCNPMEPFYR